jgi:hypothetical protein
LAFYEVIAVPNDHAALINSIAVYHRRITGEYFCGVRKAVISDIGSTNATG